MDSSSVVLVLLVSLAAAACGPPAMPRPRAPAERGEPARSAAAIDGEVLGVDRVTPVDRLESGVRLRLRPGKEGPVVVDLAPDWFLDQKGLRFAPAEHVRVEGVRVESTGEPLFRARTVHKGGQTVELRDASGEPLW